MNKVENKTKQEVSKFCVSCNLFDKEAALLKFVYLR